jgi:hypothetical protein
LETEAPRPPWYRRWRYIIPIGLLVILLVVSIFPVAPLPPKSRDQAALDRTIYYFASNYNTTLGLIPEFPGSHTYWLSSDNYLAALAIEKYSTSNQSTISFASALESALGGYSSTLPTTLEQNQYAALNSTKAYFDCSANYAISWSAGGQTVAGNGSAILETTANDQSLSCASENYADLLLLQAIHYHRIGNTAQATLLYQNASKDFDGTGFVDISNQIGSSTGDIGSLVPIYQTYKLALYVYSTYCLGVQSTASNLSMATATLLHLQSNSTGGFSTSYSTKSNGVVIATTSGVNTETTALSALALELAINPSASC